MEIIWIAFAGGVLAFAHCLGMCGPFALHLSQGGARGLLVRHLLWHLGKTTTYVFLGALAGLAGAAAAKAWQGLWLPRVLSAAAGGLMLVMGLQLLGVRLWPRRTRQAAEGSPGLLAGLVGSLFSQPGPAGALVLGVATGFLPCPIVVAFLALAAREGSLAIGMATMAAMGLGTVWSLLLLGLGGRMLSLGLRRWARPVAAGVVILMGLATVLRGTDVFHHVLGCPQAQAAPTLPPGDNPAPAPHSCCAKPR